MVNRCIIQGLFDDVLQLGTPHHVVLAASTLIGIANAFKGEGPNHILVNELMRELTVRQCSYHFDCRKGEEDALNRYVANHQR